jgi:ketosteroid isomerase-like protein
MSRENVEVIRRGYEEFAAGRLEEYFERVADPEFELDMSNWGPAAYTYRGRDGFRRFLRALDRLWERFEIEPQRFVDVDNRVVVIIGVQARGRESGVEVTAQYANTWTFRQGKVVRAEWFQEPDKALKAAGLEE